MGYAYYNSFWLRKTTDLPGGDHFPSLLRNRALYHLFFWIAYYLFGVTICLSIYRIYEGRFYIELLSTMVPDILLVYLNLYLLIPFLLASRKYISYILALAASILIQATLTVWLHRMYALSGTTAFLGVMDFNTMDIANQALNALYLVALTMGLKFVKDGMLQERQWREKEKAYAETELNLLKSQMHPHFFFNTLNNLYSLTVQKSDLAPEIVLKLSDLMSYILYDAGATTVPLEREIAHLENYIELEKLRFGERAQVIFDKPEQVEGIRVPPLILIAFVENSFKHGLGQDSGTVSIHLTLDILPGHIYFDISNPAGSPVAGREIGGIGLSNVTRRLDLLFSDRYSLDMGQLNGWFRARLTLPQS